MHRFMAAIERPGHPVRRVQHLHLSGSTRSHQRIFAACPRIVTLWIDEYFGAGRSLGMHVLMQLDHLRELTIPALYGASAELWVGVVLPNVTHLHFCTVRPTDPLHDDVFEGFPNLTHLGFAAEPSPDDVHRALKASDTLGVLVRGTTRHTLIVDPRVVYLVQIILDEDRDWLKRASPDWWAWDEAAWDQWTFFDAVMDARKTGKLLARSWADKESGVGAPQLFRVDYKNGASIDE
ncbi:hypothetical protein B0H12DRAFT_1080391 [Mycena haematopus]|nr:hypothetical protein B0H12DRAFT_1080391 [Mycena haematopus]